jgi:hypothetical protein
LQRPVRAVDAIFPAVLTVRRVLAILLIALVAAACGGNGGPATPIPTPAATPSATPAPATPAAPSPTPPAAGNEIKCDLGGHDAAYHIHALVGVKINGQLYAPPANIGIGTDCMYWVHTHAADGIVHIEAPASVNPTLGDFMGLWSKSFPDDELLKTAQDAIAAGKVTVDDKPFTGDPLSLVLQDKMRIFLGG